MYVCPAIIPAVSKYVVLEQHVYKNNLIMSFHYVRVLPKLMSAGLFLFLIKSIFRDNSSNDWL